MVGRRRSQEPGKLTRSVNNHGHGVALRVMGTPWEPGCPGLVFVIV